MAERSPFIMEITIIISINKEQDAVKLENHLSGERAKAKAVVLLQKQRSGRTVSKEERRREAELRNRTYRTRQSLKKKIDLLEKNIEEKSQEYASCMALLSDPALYQEKVQSASIQFSG